MEYSMDYKKDEIQKHWDEWLMETIEHQGNEWVLANLEDLHNYAFNQDYYIIGTARAIEWMGDKSWDIMNFVNSYEVDNFGELHTELTNPEKLVNMYVYIIGEEIVAEYVAQKEAA